MESVYLKMITEKMKQKAVELGHINLEYDPPANHLSNANRLTCKDCGCAIVCYGGNIYGSAIERACKVSK